MSIKLKDIIYDLINNSDKLDGKDSSAFSLASHTHSDYALSDHTHNYANSSHTHNYTSTIKIGSNNYNVSGNIITLPDYPTSLKNPNSLTIQANGTSLGSYDGSTEKTINITYSNIGAASSSHTHSYLPLSGGTLTGGITLGSASNTSHLSYYIIRNGNTIGLGSDYYNTCLRFSPSTGDTHFLKLSDAGMHYSADSGNTWSTIIHSGNISSYNEGSASLIKSSLGTYAASTWNPQSSFTNIWAEKFGYSNLGTDTGDLVFYLRKSQYVNNGVELCLAIDGDYYANSGQSKVIHTGNISSYIPTSLPANGGNADTVDGYHASSFALSSHTHSYLSTNIASSLTSTATVNYANTPYGVNYRNHYSGHGLGSYRGVLSCKDSAVGFELNSYWCVNPTDGVGLNNLFYRVKRDSASDWGPYARIIDSGNIGSQSVNYATTAGALTNLTRTTQAVWGTLTSANGYKNLGTWDESDGSGGSLSIQSKGGQISMQIDGEYYANEGRYKVIHEGNIGNYVTGGTSSNADTVDGYHASSLWRSDGGTWNPNANIALNATANGQEWSFDITRNGKTGCYWHVWDSSLNSMLVVNADNGRVTACYSFDCGALFVQGQQITFVT